MTTFNTGNPIGSTDARDLSDNAENFDKALNSTAGTWNDRLGVTRDTFEGALSKLSFYRVGTFAAGYKLTNMRQTLEYSGHEYSWAGSFPKVVAANATPATSGGIGAGAWVDRTDIALRAELGNFPIAMSYVLKTIADHSDAYEYALSTGKTVIVDVPIKLTRDVIKSENEPVDLIYINDSKITGINYAPRLRSNPEHRLTCTSKRVFFPYRDGDTRFETLFAQDGVVSGRNKAVRQNMVTACFGADSIDSTFPHVWALNTVTNVHKNAATSAIPGAGSEHYGYELDVNVDTDNTGSGAIVEGLRVAGAGDLSSWPLAYAIHVMRDNSGRYKWPVGVFIEECKTGLYVRNPTVYAALFCGDKSMTFIPNAQYSNELINVRNPADTMSLFSVDDVGRASVASLKVGGGSVCTKTLVVNAPNVGFGDIASGSSSSKTFAELFGTLNVDLPNSLLTVSYKKTGALPAGVHIDCYYDNGTSNAYVRVTNTGATTFLNTAITLKVEIRQY